MTDPLTIPTMLRDAARWIDEMPAYEGADPELLRDAAGEIDLLRAKLEAAKEPAIDPEKIAAIDNFLQDGERDNGYRAFVMMRKMWPQLRNAALQRS